MRKRGPRGGGTVRKASPQQGQRPSSLMGPVASARSQWPRASHSGLMHCTVKPGKYCMRLISPSGGRWAAPPLLKAKYRPWLTDGLLAGLWSESGVVSSKKATIYSGRLAVAVNIG